ncbi:MAG: polysaccharide deacetylase family protein, partial [Phycisphaerae bacterium]|nr:polysaccharide deacetylase family protein [Phycisphaerae bacterium]
MPAHGVMFHHFHDDFHPRGPGSLGAGDLLRIIHKLGRDRILPARQWLERACRNSLRDDDLCLTFDDCLLSQFDVALPVLRDLDLTAFFFVPSSVLEGHAEPMGVYRHFRITRFDTVEAFYHAFYAALEATFDPSRLARAMLRFNPREYLSQYPFYSPADRRFRFIRDEVLGPEAFSQVMDRMMADCGYDAATVAGRLWMRPAQVVQLHAEGHVIGLHSHTHPRRLQRLSPQQQREEYGRNWRAIRQLTGEAPQAMAHPNNSYSPYTLAILRQLGVRIGF